MKMLKGKLVIAQSGGPTAVINASLAGVLQEARKYESIDGIYGLVHGIEGALKEELMDLEQELLQQGLQNEGPVDNRPHLVPASE